jgi:Cof subfamily protein (haloacid dehalogenase superfamily)
MTPYKLFATDLDGTLFGPEMVLTPRLRRAIQALQARDCHVVIATGRMYKAALPFWKELALTSPLITYQGALVRHPSTGLDLYHRPLGVPLATEAIQALEEAGMHVNLYVDDSLYIKRRGPEAESYLALARIEPCMCHEWQEALVLGGPTKIVGIGTEKQVADWGAVLKARFGDRLFITPSLPTFLEMAHPEINKGHALRQVAAHLGVEMKHVVAVGDGMNDQEMLITAGLGVAMGNAPEALKAQANRVTAPVSDEGAARLIEALIAEDLV